MGRLSACIRLAVNRVTRAQAARLTSQGDHGLLVGISHHACAQTPELTPFVALITTIGCGVNAAEFEGFLLSPNASHEVITHGNSASTRPPTKVRPPSMGRFRGMVIGRPISLLSHLGAHGTRWLSPHRCLFDKRIDLLDFM